MFRVMIRFTLCFKVSKAHANRGHSKNVRSKQVITRMNQQPLVHDRLHDYNLIVDKSQLN
jgi:hypothetical protein